MGHPFLSMLKIFAVFVVLVFVYFFALFCFVLFFVCFLVFFFFICFIFNLVVKWFLRGATSGA